MIVSTMAQRSSASAIVEPPFVKLVYRLAYEIAQNPAEPLIILADKRLLRIPHGLDLPQMHRGVRTLVCNDPRTEIGRSQADHCEDRIVRHVEAMADPKDLLEVGLLGFARVAPIVVVLHRFLAQRGHIFVDYDSYRHGLSPVVDMDCEVSQRQSGRPRKHR